MTLDTTATVRERRPCGRKIVLRALAHLSNTRQIPLPLRTRFVDTPDIKAIRLLQALDTVLYIAGPTQPQPDQEDE